MKRKQFDTFLIAELIAKSMVDKLTDEELDYLSRWTESDPDNQRILDKIKDRESIQTDLRFMDELSLNNEWQAIDQKIQSSDGSEDLKIKPLYRRRRRLYKYIAGAAALCLISLIGWWMFPQQYEPSLVKDTTGLYKNDVLPGGNKAQLILSDGRILDLEDQHSQFEGEDGTLIAWAEGSVRYEDTASETGKSAYNTLRVPKGGTYQLSLSDGTQVWLNANSSISFPVVFTGSKREVRLEGEAYFDVTSDAKRPFIIKTQGTSVEVLGTQFNINSYEKDVATTLVHGSVRLTATNGATAMLSPGEQGVIAGSQIKIDAANLRKNIAWKNGEFYFKRDKLSDVVHQIALWYNIEVVMDTNLADINITGSIDRDVKLSEVLRMLKYITKLDFDLEDRTLNIKE